MHKVDVLKSNIVTNWTPIFEWYVVGWGYKNMHQKGMICYNEIGLHAQNMLTILDSILNVIGGTYMTT